MRRTSEDVTLEPHCTGMVLCPNSASSSTSCQSDRQTLSADLPEEEPQKRKKKEERRRCWIDSKYGGYASECFDKTAHEYTQITHFQHEAVCGLQRDAAKEKQSADRTDMGRLSGRSAPRRQPTPILSKAESALRQGVTHENRIEINSGILEKAIPHALRVVSVIDKIVERIHGRVP